MRAVNQPSDTERKLALIDRLREVIVGAQREARPPIVAAAARRHEEHGNRRAIGGRLQPPAHFVAVGPRQIDVEQHQRGALESDGVDRLGAVPDRRRPESGPPQHRHHQRLLRPFVLDHQHFVAGRGDRRRHRSPLGRRQTRVGVERRTHIVERGEHRLQVDPDRGRGHDQRFEIRAALAD